MVIGLEKGALIGRGRTAEIFAWGGQYILKLFYNWVSADAIACEEQKNRLVVAAGLPVPGILDTISVDNRRGIIYERIAGRTMLRELMVKPWRIYKYARLLAQLQTDIHRYSVPRIQSGRQHLEETIAGLPLLPVDLKIQILKILEQLPDGNVLCHFDFHPDNIMMSPRGPVIIDWMNSMKGNPVADLARTIILMRMSSPPPGTPGRMITRIFQNTFCRLYLEHYLQLEPHSRQEIIAWQITVAAARLAEDVPGEREKILKFIKVNLKSMLRVEG